MDVLNEADSMEIDSVEADTVAVAPVEIPLVLQIKLYNFESPNATNPVPPALSPYESRLWEEPLILRHGGRSVGQCINDVLGQLDDYDARALFKTVFTKRNFQYFYKMARGDYGKPGVPGPAWAIQCLVDGKACKDPVLRNLITGGAYRYKTMDYIDEVRRIDRGLAVLVSLEGTPTEVLYIGKTRVSRIGIAVANHPTARHVLMAVTEIMEMNLEIYVKEQEVGFQYPDEQKNMWRPFSTDPFLVSKRNQLVKAMKKATDEGNFAWFKARYDERIKNEKYGWEMKSWNLRDPAVIQPECVYCELAHGK